MTSQFPQALPRGVGLFDLDGTLIPWDCQLLFRHHVLRREPWRGIFLPVFLMFLPLAGLLGAAGMKRIFLSFLWRLDRKRLAEYASDFADTLMPAIYPELLKEIERHRLAGDFLILASASPEFYVLEIGKRLGFDLSLGTPVELGPFFPDLENHKGSAKVTRLRGLLPASWYEGDKLLGAHGYTDSTADLPMLALCERVTVVNPSPTLRQHAEIAGWTVCSLKRPWANKVGFAGRALALLLGLGKNPASLPGTPVC